MRKTQRRIILRPKPDPLEFLKEVGLKIEGVALECGWSRSAIHTYCDRGWPEARFRQLLKVLDEKGWQIRRASNNWRAKTGVGWD